METDGLHNAGPGSQPDAYGKEFKSLDLVTRPAVTTEEAAYYLNRKPQTLRGWACMENGPLRPVRFHGRLMWSVAELRRVLGVA